MASERNGIREYSRIRPFLTYIYLYGFLSREDFVDLGICGVDEYDYCTRLMRMVLPNINQSAHWKDGKKHLRFDRSYQISSESQLANSYLLHTIKNEELCEFLRILSPLTRNPATQSQLQYAFSSHDNADTDDRTSTFNRRCKELQNYGYIIKEKKIYRMKHSLLQDMNDDTLFKLYEYVSFCAETTYPRVAGSFLKRSIQRELLYRGLTIPSGMPFLLRHNDCSNIFDEDIVHKLQHAICNHLQVIAQFPNATYQIIPIALRIDTRLGRWYLLYWSGMPRLSRLNMILSVKTSAAVPPEYWRQRADEVFQAYAVSGCSRSRTEQSPYTIRAELRFGEQRGMYNQFRREIRLGSIVQDGSREYYEVMINDPIELIPLFRQYSPWLRILPGEHDLDMRIRNDLDAMRQQLEDAYE